MAVTVFEAYFVGKLSGAVGVGVVPEVDPDRDSMSDGEVGLLVEDTAVEARDIEGARVKWNAPVEMWTQFRQTRF